MLIRIQQINAIVGDIEQNAARIITALQQAEHDGIALLILPELVTCGYPPMDLLERKSFLQAVYRQNDRIVRETGRTALLFGTIRVNSKHLGRPIYNAALLAHEGNIVDVIHKTLLPTYDVFDEFRYFEPGDDIHITEWGGRKWGITICEDIWNNQNEYNYHTYEKEPAAELKRLGADVLVNISASPFTKKKPEMREAMLQGHARRLNLPVLYSNQVGANTELVFDGISSVISSDGRIVCRLATFEEDHGDVIWQHDGAMVLSADGAGIKPVSSARKSIVKPVSAEKAGIKPFPGSEERIFKALVLGLRDYVGKSGMPARVVMGLSGGIDSALTAVIAAEAMGPERVLGITMPSEFSSSGSVTDSGKLADNLGITLHNLSIESVYDSFRDVLAPLFKETAFDVAEENLQSRCRGTILMAISNKFGHMLLNTGNKSELAVGYCTLYGDMAGGLSILSDVYKTEVYAVSRWLNEAWFKKEVIPWNTINKPPSAELRPDQKDTDSLPEYVVLDGILKAYIEDQLPAEQIIGLGYPADEVIEIIRMVDRNEYKRRQAAPGLRITSKAFGMGRRLPIVQRWTEWVKK